MNKGYPKISIVTVSFNQGRFIEDNILSVIDQHYPNLEHLIIDAGSTDETIEILKKYDSCPHLHWISEPDNGQSDGLNKGFKKATGEIIGWFNSDDRVAPGALMKVAAFFNEHPEEIGVVGDQRIIDEEGKTIKVIKSRSYDYDYLLNRAKGTTQNSTFFKRTVFNKTGYLNQQLHYVMDRDLFIRIAAIRPLPYLPEVLGEFRIQALSKTHSGTYHFSKELLKIRLRYEGGRFFSSGMYADLYIILTQPLRRISWLRKFIQNLRKN